MYRIIGIDEKEYGPISADQLRQWINESRVSRTTRVKREGESEWRALGSIPEFAAAFGVLAPPELAAPQAGTVHTSGLAVASLVCGALGFVTCLTAPVGLVLGLRARNQIRREGGALAGTGYANWGIGLSLGAMLTTLVLGIVLAVLPAIRQLQQRSQERANMILCMNQARQVNLGIILYANSHTNQFPNGPTWCDDVKPMLGGNTGMFQCPANPGQRCAFAFNTNLTGRTMGGVNPRTVLIFSSDGDWNAAGGAELLAPHQHNANSFLVGFADGSVQWVNRGNTNTLRWQP